MMKVCIGIDIMEGLVLECNKSKNEQPLGIFPLNAVISCTKNVSCSRQIATHVPSLPLSIPSSSFSDKVHNFLVRWPADYDPRGDALSTFQLSRLMKRDAFYSDGTGLSSGFQPEEIELTVGIMRGSEMLTLGKATLVITGEENEELVIDLPINTEKDIVKNKKKEPPPLKRTNSKIFGKVTKPNAKILKPLSFPSDKRRKFHLTENAMIRLHVSVTPDTENNRSGDDSGASSGVSSSVFSSNDTETSSVSYSNYSTEYSSVTGSTSFNTNSGSRDDSKFHPSPSISQPNNHSRHVGNNTIRSRKYHPHVPMDELRNVEDNFERVHLKPQMSRHSPSQSRAHSQQRSRSRSRSRHQSHHHPSPRPDRSGSPGNSDAYNDKPSSSRRGRSSSNRRAVGGPNPSTRHSSRSRQPAYPGNSRSFGHETSGSTNHLSGTPRAPFPQKNARELEYDTGPTTPRNGSRNRAPDRYEVKPGHQNSGEKYRSSRELTPRRSQSFNVEDLENENRNDNHQMQKKRERRKSSKPPMGSSHYHENGARTSEQVKESPMTWLYDKMVGKGNSTEETVKMKNNEAKKVTRKGSRFSGPSIDSPHYRRPSPKRTMRV